MNGFSASRERFRDLYLHEHVIVEQRASKPQLITLEKKSKIHQIINGNRKKVSADYADYLVVLSENKILKHHRAVNRMELPLTVFVLLVITQKKAELFADFFHSVFISSTDPVFNYSISLELQLQKVGYRIFLKTRMYRKPWSRSDTSSRLEKT